MSGVSQKNKPNRCRLFVGTSGYSYTEWTEAGFYPAGTKSAGMLTHYARHFPITELNYTWYRMPRAETIAGQIRKAPSGFRFAVKLTRTLTHEIDPDDWPDQARYYRDGVAPLVQSNQLAAILVQLPPGFDRTRANRQHLAALLDTLAGLPLAVEFRHRSWVNDRVFQELERRGVCLVGVDAPKLTHLFPPLDIVTNPDLFYIRFHGRNTRGWGSGKMQLQFDYDYSTAELQAWITERIIPMCAQARTGILFFNNHVKAQAPANARKLVSLLQKEGLDVG
ncbi:MAG: DUF72 domain-containing protein [Desulfobacterales bacterium]|nr:DUF72 domain-containing protein [Desulfobacterales bacterium]